MDESQSIILLTFDCNWSVPYCLRLNTPCRSGLTTSYSATKINELQNVFTENIKSGVLQENLIDKKMIKFT